MRTSLIKVDKSRSRALADSEHHNRQFVEWFRHSTPYINAFRKRAFVVAFDGDAVADPRFSNLIHDFALLNSLGIQLVLVHGARPQIERRLRECSAEIKYVNGLRITDDKALACVKEAVGSVRMDIEALLSMGLANSPMAGARIRVASGNFVNARPIGIKDGVDYCHTGEVRRIDVPGIEQQLKDGDIVLLSPTGYSPTGEIFNLYAEDVATAAAIQLQADKLILLTEDIVPAELIRQITLKEAESVLSSQSLPDTLARHLTSTIKACRHGVIRAHLIERGIDGGLLLELFTRDGVGTLITDDLYDAIRDATINDVGGILELIEPLEHEGVLVRRSRERLETEIDHFMVVERDGLIIGCAALYPDPEHKMGELACLAIHPDYRQQQWGDIMLEYIEVKAKSAEIDRLFVLTTATSHWFLERGFMSAELDDLSVQKKSLYNYQRKSKVFIKSL